MDPGTWVAQKIELGISDRAMGWRLLVAKAVAPRRRRRQRANVIGEGSVQLLAVLAERGQGCALPFQMNAGNGSVSPSL